MLSRLSFFSSFIEISLQILSEMRWGVEDKAPFFFFSPVYISQLWVSTCLSRCRGLPWCWVSSEGLVLSRCTGATFRVFPCPCPHPGFRTPGQCVAWRIFICSQGEGTQMSSTRALTWHSKAHNPCHLLLLISSHRIPVFAKDRHNFRQLF